MAQTVMVSGTIKDEKGEPVPFATVLAFQDADTISAMSDTDGHYQISGLHPGIITIQFQSIGYDKLTLSGIMAPGCVDASLKESSLTLNEVVVRGNRSVFSKDETLSTSYVRRVPGITATMEGRKKNNPKLRSGTLTTTGDDDGFTPSPHQKNNGLAGQLTAGEVSDFSKWTMWMGLTSGELSKYSRQWNLLVHGRYAVQLTNREKTPLPGARVELHDGDKLIWTAWTDNTGKAELWAGMLPDSASLKSATIRVSLHGKDTLLRRPLVFSDAVNFITLDVPCYPQPLPLEIAIVTDATGSMQDEIDYLRQDLPDILKQAGKQYPDTMKLASVFYRDEGSEYVVKQHDFTGQLQQIYQFINQQRADQGGDVPEAVDTALYTAIHQLNWSKGPAHRLLFLLLDAPPHATPRETDQFQRLLQDAAARGIRIVPIVCSGAEKEVEYLMRTAALATNGTCIFLTDDSGIGYSHLKPSTDHYDVFTLNQLLINIIHRFTQTTPCAGIPEDTELPVTENNLRYLMGQEENNTGEDSTSHRNKRQMYWKVFPTPVQTDLQVTFTREASGTLEIFDMNGKLMHQQVLNNERSAIISMEPFSRGMYFVVYRSGGKTEIEKVVRS